MKGYRKKDTILEAKDRFDNRAASLRGILVLFIDDDNDRKPFANNNKYYSP